MARSSNSSDKTLPLIIQTELVTESSVPEIAEKTVKQVVLDWGVRRVCSRAFSRCGSLKDLFVSATVHTIEEGAFAACTHLERVQFSDGIQEIGDRAFSSCRFTELSLPDTIRKLGAGCFENCALRKVTLPAWVSVLQDSLFLGCWYLEEITLPVRLKRIGPHAFADCGYLRELLLPDSVTEIDVGAFEYCTKLRRLRIPSGLQSIPLSALHGCSSLTEIEVSPRGTCDLDRIVLKESFMMELGREWPYDTCTLPDSIRSLENTDLTRRPVINGLQFLPPLRSIPDQYCKGISWLKEVSLPDTLREIGDHAFENTPLEEITIPASVRSIGTRCFYNTPMRLLIYLGSNPNLLDPKRLGLRSDSCAIRADELQAKYVSPSLQKMIMRDGVQRMNQGEHVPKEVEALCREYTEAHVKLLWKDPPFRDFILRNHMITTKNISWFQKQLTEQTDTALRARMLQYQAEHFSQDYLDRKEQQRQRKMISELTRTTVTLSDIRKIWKTKEWENSALMISSYLGVESRITVPDRLGDKNVAAIGPYAFCQDTSSSSREMGNLTSRERRSKLTSISITVPEGIIELSDNAFAGCFELEELILPNTLLRIGWYAFDGCRKLRELRIPECVLLILPGAFNDCSSLEHLYISGYATQVPYDRVYDRPPKNLVVHAPRFSKAEYWARRNKLSFEPLN